MKLFVLLFMLMLCAGSLYGNFKFKCKSRFRTEWKKIYGIIKHCDEFSMTSCASHLRLKYIAGKYKNSGKLAEPN